MNLLKLERASPGAIESIYVRAELFFSSAYFIKAVVVMLPLGYTFFFQQNSLAPELVSVLWVKLLPKGSYFDSASSLTRSLF